MAVGIALLGVVVSVGAWDVGAAPSPVPVSGVLPPESLVGMAGPTLYCLVERQPVIGTGWPWCTPHYFCPHCMWTLEQYWPSASPWV